MVRGATRRGPGAEKCNHERQRQADYDRRRCALCQRLQQQEGAPTPEGRRVQRTPSPACEGATDQERFQASKATSKAPRYTDRWECQSTSPVGNGESPSSTTADAAHAEAPVRARRLFPGDNGSQDRDGCILENGMACQIYDVAQNSIKVRCYSVDQWTGLTHWYELAHWIMMDVADQRLVPIRC